MDVSTKNGAFFIVMSVYQRVSLHFPGKPPFSYAFSHGFPWFSHDSPTVSTSTMNPCDFFQNHSCMLRKAASPQRQMGTWNRGPFRGGLVMIWYIVVTRWWMVKIIKHIYLKYIKYMMVNEWCMDGEWMVKIDGEWMVENSSANRVGMNSGWIRVNGSLIMNGSCSEKQ